MRTLINKKVTEVKMFVDNYKRFWKHYMRKKPLSYSRLLSVSFSYLAINLPVLKRV